ncbi:MAG: hypothetical protein ACRDJE_02270 [Dehalococcoidia bacterium]
MQREQPAPSWLGPLTALMVVVILGGLAVLIWLTIWGGGAEEEEAEESGAVRIERSIAADLPAGWFEGIPGRSPVRRGLGNRSGSPTQTV